MISNDGISRAGDYEQDVDEEGGVDEELSPKVAIAQWRVAATRQEGQIPALQARQCTVIDVKERLEIERD